MIHRHHFCLLLIVQILVILSHPAVRGAKKYRLQVCPYTELKMMGHNLKHLLIQMFIVSHTGFAVNTII